MRRPEAAHRFYEEAGFHVRDTSGYWRGSQRRVNPIQVCHKCAVPFDPICANLLLFNTKPNCSRAGLIVGKSLILKSSKNVEGPIRLAGAVISQP